MNRCKRWNRYAYLSGFEKRLNRSLWWLLIIALVYSLAQHVLLANVSEVFRGGARIGDLFYDLAIAYVGAFVFYVLVVRLPLRRDRRTVYRHLAPLIGRVVGEARNLIKILNYGAGFDDSRANTLSNVQQVCQMIHPGDRIGQLILTADEGWQQATALDAIYSHIQRARSVNREILDFSTYLASDVNSLIVGIENFGHFKMFESMYRDWQRGVTGNDNLAVLARGIFDYLQMVDRLDAYRHKILETTSQRPSYLVSGSTRDSGAEPLKRYVDQSLATTSASAPSAMPPLGRPDGDDLPQLPPGQTGQISDPSSS